MPWYRYFMMPSSLKHVLTDNACEGVFCDSRHTYHLCTCICLENIQCSEMSWNFGNSLVLFCRYCIQGFFCSVIFSPFNTFKHFAPSYIHQIKIRLCFCKNCSVWYCPLTMGAKGVKWSGGIFSLHTLVGPTLLWKF